MPRRNIDLLVPTSGEINMIINGYELVLTCCQCPEQYEVFKDGKQVAYLRLRHGYFYASCPDCCDDIVYEAEPNGDGEFDDDDEREKYLTEAITAVDKWWAEKH